MKIENQKNAVESAVTLKQPNKTKLSLKEQAIADWGDLESQPQNPKLKILSQNNLDVDNQKKDRKKNKLANLHE